MLNTSSVATGNGIGRLAAVRLSNDVMLPRARNQHTAQQLTLVAIRQWERAITGVVSVPAAMALSVASGLMLVGSVIEHGFQLVEGTLAEVGRRVGEDLDEYGSPTETRDRVAGADVARPQ